MRKFYGRSSEFRRYHAKRKAKRQAFRERIESHMASISLLGNKDWDNFTVDNEPLLFSDEEDQYNYYTDEDAEEISCSTEYESENEY